MAKQDNKDGKPEIGKSVLLGNGQTMTTTSYEEEEDGDFTIGFTIG
jgi:hypothetical protein